MNQRLLKLPSGTTRLHEWGTSADDAIPFVLLHSLGLEGSSFRWLAAAMARRGACWILAPDLRGHGASTSDDDSISLEAMAQDVLDMLDAMNVRKARLLGASMGSSVARMAASQDPTRWTSVALVAGGPGPVSALAGRGPPALAGGMAAVEIETIARWFSEADIAADHECVRYARQTLLALRPAIWAASWRAMASFPPIPPLSNDLRSICIGGSSDASATPTIMHELKRAAGVKLGPLFIDGGHHLLPLSKADELAEIVVRHAWPPHGVTDKG
ncbi:alpha/beta hydrolase [Variovorax sp. LjRoot84]|uniref:alpha/beta fold hydrolase n=1 Tax=Variovorax sp. LjRoot84 TaxID=3342340 RepID=UPI003ED13614